MAGVSEGSKEVIEKDIDGLPLRDHMKVDLKAILGHFPQIDDEEPETETACQQQVSLELDSSFVADGLENDEEDPIDCLVLRQRRSSLRTHIHDPPDSPSAERKAVRFADSLGLGLEAIRDLAEGEEPPEIPHSALTALRIRRRREEGVKVVLIPSFPSPVVNEAFVTRLAERNVLLESSFVCNRELTVSGVVMVTNVDYEKTVTIRYTIDGWATHRDIPATYVPNSNDGTTDRFVFIIHLPEGFGEADPDRLGRLEFAVAYHAGEDTFWDSNDGQNYVIDCVIRNREPSISGESGTLPTDFDSSNPVVNSSLDVTSGAH